MPAAQREMVASFPAADATSNPYQRLLYEALADLGIPLAPPARLRSGWLWQSRKSVRYLHFHWLTEYYSHPRPILAGVRLLLLAKRLLLARLLGYRVVWTVHEIYAHDRFAWADRIAPRVVALIAHTLVVHDEATEEKVIQTLGRRPVVIPAGSFRGVYGSERSRNDVRAELGMAAERPLILAFGLVRRYKRLEDIVDALARVPRDDSPDFVVLVAGQVMDEAVAADLERAAAADDRFAVSFGFVPDEDVSDLLGAADALLITRQDDGTSGVLMLALSLGVPVVVADTPGYRAATRGVPSWAFAPGDASSLADALQEAARSAPELRRAARRSVEGLATWPEVARKTAAVLRGERA